MNEFYKPKYSYIIKFRSQSIMEVVRLLGSPETSLKESRRSVMVPERSLELSSRAKNFFLNSNKVFE